MDLKGPESFRKGSFEKGIALKDIIRGVHELKKTDVIFDDIFEISIALSKQSTSQSSIKKNQNVQNKISEIENENVKLEQTENGYILNQIIYIVRKHNIHGCKEIYFLTL